MTKVDRWKVPKNKCVECIMNKVDKVDRWKANGGMAVGSGLALVVVHYLGWHFGVAVFLYLLVITFILIESKRKL